MRPGVLHPRPQAGDGGGPAGEGLLPRGRLQQRRHDAGRRLRGPAGQVGRQGSARPGYVWVGAARPGHVQLGMARPGYVRVGEPRPGYVRVGEAIPGYVRVGPDIDMYG